MTNETTIRKLAEMRLPAMADGLRKQIEDPLYQSLSFEERIGLLVDQEYSSRKNHRLERLIVNATLDQPHASIADINFGVGRQLDKSLIATLATCAFIREAHNLIIMGATGAGKSYLACAFGIEACKNFFTVRYIRLPELLYELAIARGDGTYRKMMKAFRKVNLLILDEWMLVSLSETEARDLLEIIHARHKKSSTIFCSQFAPAGWHKKIGEETIADAILDRIVHDSYTIEIHGDSKDDHSMRELYGIHASTASKQ
jgi:DNA replication protein DnaC